MRPYFWKTIIMIAVILTFFIGCSKEKKSEPTSILFPDSFYEINMKRSSEIRTFENKSLWEYINGGAEIYLAYNFVKVVTADYKKGELEIVADIYQFKSRADAFGLYSVFRQPDAMIVKLGVEGFSASPTINFVKDKYFVKLTGYDNTEEGSLALINLAEQLSKRIPGSSEMPEGFGLFPSENQLTNTTKYFAESFSGQKFLTEIYSIDYSIGKDTVTLFITDDTSGNKYMQWLKFTEELNKRKDSPKSVIFDENLSFIYNDSYYGELLIGLKNNRLAGVINYKGEQVEFINKWLESLQ